MRTPALRIITAVSSENILKFLEVIMRRYQPVFPYENENREALLSMPFQIFSPKRITLFCSVLCSLIEENAPVCRGQCVGYDGEYPVYCSIEGRIDHIRCNEHERSGKKYRLSISQEIHRGNSYCEIPFYQEDGSHFLRQLGLHPPDGVIMDKDVLWVDGVESEPFCSSGYRLLAEETVKIILGADILGRCYGVKTVRFCIEKQWPDIRFLLEKYLKKYEKILDQHIGFEICEYTRCCPAPYLLPGRLIFYPQVMLHAYNGYYEKMPAVWAYVTVAGSVFRAANYIIPAGTHVGDVIAECGMDGHKPLRFVLDGAMTGKSVPPDEGIIMPENISLCVFENKAYSESACVDCRCCAAVCPVHLKPYKMDEHTLNHCIQCGCCSYVCPSHIRLSEKIRHRVKIPENSLAKHQRGGIPGRRRRTHVRGNYVEIADEFADMLETLDTAGDAPPHIHSSAVLRDRCWKSCILMLPLYAWAAAAFGSAMFVRGAVLALTAVAVVFLGDTRSGRRKRRGCRRQYAAPVFMALAAGLVLPAGFPLIILIIVDITACILEWYNL